MPIITRELSYLIAADYKNGMATRPTIRCSAGFTLLELMVTLAVLGIVIALAAPTFTETIARGRLTSQINELVGDLAYARSEAATRAVRVTVCASTDGATCAAGDATWALGRLVFVDRNGNGDRENTEPVLRASGALSGGSTLVMAGPPNTLFIRFRPFGGLDPAVRAIFTLCNPSSANGRGRQVAVEVTGRAAASQVDCP